MSINFDPSDLNDMVSDPWRSAAMLASVHDTSIPEFMIAQFWALPILWEMHGEICRLKKRLDEVERNIDAHTLRP